jgi:histidinol-phosphate phosphatase family protein
MATLRRAAFLDRDGTFNVRPAEHDYVKTPEEFAWLPGAVEGAVALARAGYLLFVVSNQRGIARGLVTTDTLQEIEAEIQRTLAPHGAQITAFRYCPHEADEGCTCRKPRPGLILDLARDYEIDLRNSWTIGDSPSDVEAGRAAGTHTALIAAAGTADLLVTSLVDFAAALVRQDDPAANSDTSA